MIVDSSAVVAILRDEPDAERYAVAIAAAVAPRMSAANWLESAIVLNGGDPAAGRRLDELMTTAGIAIESVTLEQVVVARDAYRDFGKGSGHRARLNFGDCFAYALAATTGEPLLFKGDDFGHTDLRPALDQKGAP